MLSHTSTEWAPWYVLPADHKWFSRLCAAAVIAQTLIDDRSAVPSPGPGPPAGTEAGRKGTRGRGTTRDAPCPGRVLTRPRRDLAATLTRRHP